MKVWAAIHQGPSASGRERHFAPLSWRQMIALIVRRRCRGGTLAAGRQASISGASTSHCSSVRPIASSSKPEERPPRPRVQALTGPSPSCQAVRLALWLQPLATLCYRCRQSALVDDSRWQLHEVSLPEAASILGMTREGVRRLLKGRLEGRKSNET